MFLSEIKNKAQILLKEDIYQEFNSPIKENEKAFNNEFTFSFYK